MTALVYSAIRNPKSAMISDAIDRIAKARQYTLALIEDIEDDLWFVKPEGCPTHVAWQVGHLGFAQYALCLMRVRDAQPGDRDIISRPFRKQFSKGTTPGDSAEDYPSPEEIRATVAAVHEQAMKEMPAFDEEQFTQPLAAPHQMFDTRLGALEFCALHEMIHAGQIGLLRRMLGKEPLR